MRYIVTFFDRSSRRVPEAAGKMFMEAMHTRSPIDYKGSRYAGSSIVSVKPIHVHEEELREEAAENGQYRCRYGRLHGNRSECHCKEAGYAKVLEAREEQLLLEDGRDNADRKALPSGEQILRSNAETLGFADAERMDKTKGTWTKAGDVPR